MPRGSIGEGWCRHSLWASIGWPTESATPVKLEIQETRKGLLVRATTDGMDTGMPHSSQVTLVALDFDTMTATVQRLP